MKTLSKKTKRIKRIKKIKNKPKESAFFLEKLFKILKKKKYNKIIKWNEDGTIVIILDPIKFSNKILRTFCNHDNYTSFVRQLNLYGFHKNKNIYMDDKEQYYNENFRKDSSIEEIRNIRRKDLINDNDENLTEKEKKEQIMHLEQIDKEGEDEKKIEEYKKIIENGNMNIKYNIHVLEFLIKKNKERNIFYEKIKKDIYEFKNKNNLKNIKINDFANNNNKLQEINIIKEKNENFKKIERIESFTLNENKRLFNAFKNVNEKKIEKSIDNKNKLKSSFCDDLSLFGDNSKNILNAQSQTRTSFILLNKSGIIEQNHNNNNNNININDNFIFKNNMNNSFS